MTASERTRTLLRERLPKDWVSPLGRIEVEHIKATERGDLWVMLRDTGSFPVDPDGYYFVNPPLGVRGTQIVKRRPLEAFRPIVTDAAQHYASHPLIWGDTTTTVFADTTGGRILSTNTTYATARSGSSLVVNTTGVAADFHHSVGQTFATPNYTIYEGFYQFDTSGIGDTDTIDSAVFSLHGHTDNSVTDFTINCRLKDWGTGLTTADWVAGADLSALTLLATFATSGFTTSGYNDFTSAGKHGSHRWRQRQRPPERCTTMGPSLPADRWIGNSTSSIPSAKLISSTATRYTELRTCCG